jgi:tRNA-specific 2-thiouridylase
MARVFVAMSGGVDSSVAAALLAQQGHDVVGVTMRLLDEDAPGGCCPSGSVRGAKRVCDTLGIPHYVWDMREAFEREVVGDFVHEYARGRTPNPCVVCNDRVKSDELLHRALAAGADLLATGHYARIVSGPDGPRVARGLDAGKDQSYFLYRSMPEQLERMVFPVGEMRKDDVRALARALGLPSAEARESQEACFVPGGDVRSFLRRRLPDAFVAGDIVDRDGRVVGRHEGAAGYTVGQRHGLGGGAASRRYVTAVVPERATVAVGTREDLAVSELRACSPVWHGGTRPVRVEASVRYRGRVVPATARCADGELVVEFDRPVDAAAPGQAVVCWDGGIVIGGGVIGEGP